MAQNNGRLRRISYLNTNRCNLRCVYCPQGSHPDEYHADLTPEFFEELFDFIKANRIEDVGFGFYGEITMIEGWWKQVRRLHEIGVRTTATTNGSTPLSEEEVATFARFKYIEWSIDTHEIDLLKTMRKKVDPRTIVHNFHLVRSHCILNDLPVPDMVWSGVLTIDVAHTMPRFVAFASSCGVKTVNFNEVGIYEGAVAKKLNLVEQDDEVFLRAAEHVERALELAGKLGIEMRISELPRMRARKKAMDEGKSFTPSIVRTSTPVADVLVHNECKELPPGFTRDCPSPWEEMLIDPKGQVFACCIRGDVMGVAKTRAGLEAVFRNEKYRALRASLETGVDLDSGCANCVLRGPRPVLQPDASHGKPRGMLASLRKRLRRAEATEVV